MITLEKLELAKAKAQELWNTYHSEDAENIIKREIFCLIVDDTDSNAKAKLAYLTEVWESVKELDPVGYWGFDAVGIEFCKMLERAYKFKELGILI